MVIKDKILLNVKIVFILNNKKNIKRDLLNSMKIVLEV
jgi:hypothetical protein